MAKLKIIEHDDSTDDNIIIKKFLRNEGIPFDEFELNNLSLENSKKKTLTDSERSLQIESFKNLVFQYHKNSGYRSDMICLYPEFEHLDFVLSKFKDIHYHFENEHWYITDGTLGFGFLSRDGFKFSIELFPGEHITVPEGKWQWLIPPSSNILKSMRFFTTTGLFVERENVLSVVID